MPSPGAINPLTGKRYDWEAQQRRLREDALLEGAVAATKKQLAVLRRQQKAAEARDNLLTFTQFTMPDPEAPNDVDRTKYEAAAFHAKVAATIEKFLKGELRHEDGRACTQLIFCMPPRHGKACAHDTPVLTPLGWRQHGDLRPGDEVFGVDGKPTRVLAVSADVDQVVPVALSNGEVIRCHPNHEWTVYDRAEAKWRTMETREIAARILRSGNRCVLQLPPAAAIEYEPAFQSLHPYVLGAWLGDGSASGARIAHSPADQEVVAAIAGAGHAVSRSWVQKSTGVAYTEFAGRRGVGSAMQRALKYLGVLNNKHIPKQYLRASKDQRLQLLAGLVDTDGHVERKTGRVRFSTCSEALRDGVFDLAAGLGFRPYVTTAEPTLSTSGTQGRKPVYQVGFQPTEALPTRIPRKRIAVFAKQRRVGIVSVGAVEKAGARSIQIDRADGLYLVGRRLVPTHNTELATKRACAWYSGRHPDNDVIVASASDLLAQDMGADVRTIMTTPQFKQVFPNHQLMRGGTAKDNLQTVRGGRLIFAGRGGTINGRGAHLLLIDDLYKDFEEARSEAVRDTTWNWLTKVALMRRMGKRLTIVTMTRWHSDDIIGRLTDPENPHYNAEEAASWMIIRLPGVAEEDDPLGRKPGEALWPQRYDEEYHRGNQRRDPLGFAALVQQTPTVADGVLFRRENIQYIRPQFLPEKLRFYCASDHAVGLKQRNDPSCLGKVGVDPQNNIYVFPPIWKRMPTDEAVEAMLTMATDDQPPIYWWAERGHITGSIGPFLRKRMEETGRYINLIEVTPKADKEQRAQSIAARVAMGKVYFVVNRDGSIPHWAERAVNEMMAFPNGVHDDFVDMLAYIGLGIQNLFAPSDGPKKPKNEPQPGSLAWLRQMNKHAAERTAYRGY